MLEMVGWARATPPENRAHAAASAGTARRSETRFGVFIIFGVFILGLRFLSPRGLFMCFGLSLVEGFQDVFWIGFYSLCLSERGLLRDQTRAGYSWRF